MAEPSDIPIVILAFNRPNYLAAVLTSLMEQKDVDLTTRRIYLLQDGGRNPFSGTVHCSDSVMLENNDLFRRLVPHGIPLLSHKNLGVALNFDRAERLVFDDLKAEAGIFLEDDLVLGPYYLKTLEKLIGLALADERIGYVAAYGDHRAPLENQRAHASQLRLMGHNWAFALTRRQWLKQRPYVDQYLDIVRTSDYRRRDHDRIVDLFHSWGLGVPGTSQDIAKSHACILTGTAKVVTYAAFGRYIGQQGLHFTADQFEKMGFSDAQMLEEDAFTLVPPTDAQLNEFITVARRSAMVEIVARKAPAPVPLPVPLPVPVPVAAVPKAVAPAAPAPAAPAPVQASAAPAAAAPASPPAATPAQPPRQPASPAEAQTLVRELIRLNQIAAADTVAREWLRKAPEFRDQFRHPAFLKELTRISLFKGDFAEAQTFAMQLTAQIPANDPCVNVLFARAFDLSGSRAAAAVEWRAVLRKDPGNLEAQRALQAPHAAAGD